ncbi:hypothetical protein EDD18DRAFT_1174415 [Armillaria luteobubalina]|uniref:Uncharacterized protein n=1 Tax=Armillaria luteobubalina TaxID=153913 RepID=A0AA39Q1D4_9AGAR|nr:hypothetical protein EDD18DRAFT_1174415 [Armillaria luteobubalina]
MDRTSYGRLLSNAGTGVSILALMLFPSTTYPLAYALLLLLIPSLAIKIFRAIIIATAEYPKTHESLRDSSTFDRGQEAHAETRLSLMSVRSWARYAHGLWNI